MTKLYEDDIAPNCRRVRIFLAEKGVEVAGEKLSIGGGDNLADDYQAKNPHGILSLFELDDGTRIGESIAICRYVEELHPEPPLFGRDALEKATVDMWDRRADLEGMLAVGEFFRNTVPFFVDRAVPGRNDFAQTPELAERGKARTEVFFRHLDRRLGETEYLAGEHFTNADISAMCATGFAEFSGLAIPDDCSNVGRWFDQVNARPSAKAWPRMAEALAQAQSS